MACPAGGPLLALYITCCIPIPALRHTPCSTQVPTGADPRPASPHLSPLVPPPQYLRDRLKMMQRGMLKPPGRPNTMFDSSVAEKLQGRAKSNQAGERLSP